MTVTIATHSYKGGTGKTIFTVNLAALLAKQGASVVILDLDLSAPSVYTFVDEKLRRSVPNLNQVLLQDINIDQALIDVTESLVGSTDGKLLVGLASHQSDAIMKITRRNVKEYSDDASKLFNWISLLSNKPYDVDYILIDTSPGMSFAAVNCIAASDISLVLLRVINADLEGTRDMVLGLHSKLGVEMKFLANQIPSEFFDDGKAMSKIETIIHENIISQIQSEHAHFSGIIPRDPEIVKAEISSLIDQTSGPNRQLHVIGEDKEIKQTHFTESLLDLIEQIKGN